jgi:hypothetical protein
MAQGRSAKQGLLVRIVAAAVGGYVVAMATAICLSYGLPMRRADAVLTGVLASFVVYIAAVLWAFAARNTAHAWLGIAVPAVVAGGMAWAIGWFGAL